MKEITNLRLQKRHKRFVGLKSTRNRLRCFLFYMFFGLLFTVRLNGQNVTLSVKSAAPVTVFKQIEKQTGYFFIYAKEQLSRMKPIDLDVKNTELNKVLNMIFSVQPFSYIISGNNISIKEKTVVVNQDVSPSPSSPITISGRVSDQDGKPLDGANVFIKGGKKGVTTDMEGKFSIQVPKSGVSLLVTFVGYNNSLIDVVKSEFLNITLKQKDDRAVDVVVIGYGTVNKKDLTGSVGKVDMEDFHKAPVPSFDQALAGRVAGVVVTSGDGQPGAGSQITIRGNSYTQDASPLYVVDGFPIENMDINSINPNDIESLEVLKDASAIAVYGSRAAYGVIMITTKTGKIGSPILNYNVSHSTQKVIKTIAMMSPYEFVKLQIELDSLSGTPAAPVNTYSGVYLNPALGVNLDFYKKVKGDDWQSLLLRNGSIMSHNLNLTGGNADTKYTLSGSAYNHDGIIINTGMKRYTGKFVFDQKMRQNLKVGVNLNFTNTMSFGTVPTAGNGGGVVQGMWQYRPISGINSNQNLLNSLIDSTALQDFFNGTSTSTLGDNLINPLVQAENELRKNRQNVTTLHAYIQYTLSKNFSFKTSGGYSSTDLKNSYFYNSKTQQGNIFVNSAGAMPNTLGINGGITDVLVYNLLNENILTYNGKIGYKHVFNAIAGVTYQYGESYASGFKSIDIPQSQESQGLDGLGNGTASAPASSRLHNQLYSFVSRVNYTYNKIYLFTATLRSDGTSRLAPGHQWGYFPSGAFAWRFKEEPFIKKFISNVVSDGKLRFSYGLIGSNKVNDVNYALSVIDPRIAYPMVGGYVPGYAPTFYANPNLTWETAREFDLGMNLGFLDDRITIEADYYEKKNNNFLMSVTLPALAGYYNGLNQQYQNAGVILNNGFELAINTRNITTKDFNWQTSFNISFNRNKILSFTRNVESIATGWGLTGNAQAWIAKVGGPVSEYFGYKAIGLYQYKDFNRLANGTYVLKPGIPTYSPNIQPGDQKYADLNHDGVIDSKDETSLGSYQPIHTGGLTNNFRYKSFSLNVFMQWSYGNQVLNANKVAFETTGSYFAFGNQFASYANRWTPNNTNTDIPRALPNTKGDESGNTPKPSSRFIEDGSFIRLKTIQLNYELPRTMLTRINLVRASVYVSAQNLLTLTHYSGIDPEVSTIRTGGAMTPPVANMGSSGSGVGYTYIQPSAGTPVLAGGYDYTPYPRAFNLVFGLNITL